MTAGASVAILGASGYTGGELCRLLLGHPGVTLTQATSRGNRGEPVARTHPNLRGVTDLAFIDPADLRPADVLFCCLPHGELAGRLGELAPLAGRVVDLSADFRLRDPARYERWYGEPHPDPSRLGAFVYGLPELNREAIRGARCVSGVGCNATAINLALAPLAAAGLIERAVVEVKVGSSEGGAAHSAASHHPVRAGATRTFAPAGHRHQAEVEQMLMDRSGPFPLHVTGTAVQMVRGALATAQVFTTEPVDGPRVWAAFRELYTGERFVRIVKERRGLHRLPDPALLAGSNFCDVGFEIDTSPGSDGRRVVCLAALDNLMKGAAGTAVQCMNLMLGFEEDAGLGFPGLFPA